MEYYMNWKSWLYTLIAGIIGGASTALSTAFALPQDGNFTPAGLTNAWHVALIGALVPTLMYLSKSPLPPLETVATKTQSTTVTNTTKVGVIALIFLLLSAGCTGCNGTTVATDIVNWMPVIESTTT